MNGFRPIGSIDVEAQLKRMEELRATWPKCPDCGEPYLDECEPCAENRRAAEMAALEEIKTKERDIKRLGGLKAYEDFTFAKYGNQPAIDKCEGFPDINIYLWGAAGVGKTHLATAIARQFKDGWIFKPQQIYRKCRGLKDGAEEQAAIDKYIKVPVLVIDDLGVDKRTDFSFSTLYEIIDGRDMARRNGMIITSNLSLNGLAERLGDDRIASRIAGMCRVVEIVGKDYRIGRKL